jgi:hypothetical protein
MIVSSQFLVTIDDEGKRRRAFVLCIHFLYTGCFQRVTCGKKCYFTVVLSSGLERQTVASHLEQKSKSKSKIKDSVDLIETSDCDDNAGNQCLLGEQPQPA